MLKDVPESLKKIGTSFKLEPFATIIQPIIQDVLAEHKKDKYRKGTLLTPLLMVWLILALTLRRDINYHKTLNWLVSGLSWMSLDLPSKLIKDGAISHARVKLGSGVFQDIFYKFVLSFTLIIPDFHGLVTVMFDGTSMTMPDTKSNEDKFGKPKSRSGSGAFPQMRVVALMVMSARLIFDVAYAPFRGKKTGERTLMFKILEKIKRKDFLFLFDAGFYSFFLAWYMKDRGQNFIMKVSSSVKLCPVPGSRMPDGSYLAVIEGQIQDVAGSASGRKKWKKVTITVRVIVLQIPGFRPVRLITTILDQPISAKEIVIHYHKRWDIEIAYDEIKTHQCATLKGQMPTILRSKRADLVEQELYAMLITYNLIRSLIYEAASKHNKDPRLISFLDSLQEIIDAAPIISYQQGNERKRFDYLLSLIADSLIDRPRRPRVNPRVVKVKMSNFKRKRSGDKSKYRDFEKEIKIIPLEEAA
jgi:hypothetical protein